MPPEEIDDNLEHVLAEWLQRLQAGKISRKEACGVLDGMKARLDFLHNLNSQIAENAEFAGARDVKREIERQAEEIESIRRFLDGE